MCIPRDRKALGKGRMPTEWEIPQTIKGKRAEKNENIMNMHKSGFFTFVIITKIFLFCEKEIYNLHNSGIMSA